MASTSFFLRLVFFSFFAVVFLFLWQHFLHARFQTNLDWFILFFFIFVTTTVYVILTKATKGDPKKFITTYLMISGLKLFGYLTIILVYGLLNRQSALGFTLFFLLMYFFFTAFEAITLSKEFKK